MPKDPILRQHPSAPESLQSVVIRLKTRYPCYTLKDNPNEILIIFIKGKHDMMGLSIKCTSDEKDANKH